MQFDATGDSLTDLCRSLNVENADAKEALVRLAEKVSRLEHEAEYQQMLWGEEPARAAAPLTPPRKHRRDRHGMHIVRGLAVPVLVAGGLVHWLLRARWHRVLVAGVGSVVLAGGTLAPDLMHPSAAPPASAAVHRHVEHHRRAPAPQEIPVAVPPRRKRRRPDLDAAASPTPSPSPSAAAPGPAPTVPDPLPSPLPTVSVPPSPTPLPTCVLLTGKHCHGAEVVVPQWALAGLPALP